MSCIVWNCRGLGNHLRVQELVKVVQVKAPSVVFLAETLTDKAWLDYVKDRIQFEKMFFVPRMNNGGGLVLYWKISVEIDIESSSVNYIDVTVNKNYGDPGRFTGFYGEPETHKRQESWDLLRSLHGQSLLPWLCVGDFNKIIKQLE